MNQQLADYIQQQVRNGYALTGIRDFLIRQGYALNDVDEAINFVSEQRLMPIINYIKDSLGKGFDQDTIKARLLAMGYQAPDINDALARSLAKKNIPLPTIVIIVLVASVIFGLGLFFMWPKARPVETAGPGIIEGTPGTTGGETGTAGTTPKFETMPTVTPATGETNQEQQDQGLGSYPGFNVAETGQPEENQTQENAGQQTQFTAETSEFEDLISQASKETNVDNAISICRKTDNAMYRDACYDQLSKSFDSSALCAKIEDQSLRDSCYMSIIMKKKDYTLCGQIVDPSLKSSCESLKESLPAGGNITMENIADIPI